MSLVVASLKNNVAMRIIHVASLDFYCHFFILSHTIILLEESFAAFPVQEFLIEHEQKFGIFVSYASASRSA